MPEVRAVTPDEIRARLDAAEQTVTPLRDPERDLATDPADEEARRWERELARADVARRDP